MADHPLCMHLVMCGHFTWQRWRSHHSICHMAEKPTLHANLMALCFTELGLWPLKVLHWGNRDFPPFPPVAITLTRWPSYTNLTRLPWRYIGCKSKLPTTRLSKVIIWQTDRHDRNYIPCHFTGGNNTTQVYYTYNTNMSITFNIGKMGSWATWGSHHP